jgi:hypothetical protein
MESSQALSNAVDMLYESVKTKLSISKELFIDTLKGWEIIPLWKEKEIIGAVLLKGNEIHVGYGKPCGASMRLHIKQTLKKVLNKYGYAITYVMNDNIIGLNFCKRLGFIELSKDSVKILLRCDGSKYV